MALSSFLSNQGTQTSLLTDNTGGLTGTLVPVMKVDISTIGTAGTIWNGNPSGGTINTLGTLPNLPGGTIGSVLGIGSVSGLSNLPGGTLNAGTFRADARSTQNIVTYGTNVGSSGANTATIIGSSSVGVGTSLWVNDFSLLNPNSAAATIILGFGTPQQGTNVLFRGILGTNGAIGLEKSYAKAVNAGMTNQDLVLSLTGAGTVDFSISYFISA